MSFEISDIINLVAAAAIAVLSGLGIGSGGLLVIWLTEIMRLPQTQARSINLLFFLFSAGIALLIHMRHSRPRYRLVLGIAALGIAGTLIGTYLGNAFSPELVRKIFGGMLVISGIYTLSKKHTAKKSARALNSSD